MDRLFLVPQIAGNRCRWLLVHDIAAGVDGNDSLRRPLEILKSDDFGKIARSVRVMLVTPEVEVRRIYKEQPVMVRPVENNGKLFQRGLVHELAVKCRRVPAWCAPCLDRCLTICQFRGNARAAVFLAELRSYQLKTR